MAAAACGSPPTPSRCATPPCIGVCGRRGWQVTQRLALGVRRYHPLPVPKVPPFALIHCRVLTGDGRFLLRCDPFVCWPDLKPPRTQPSIRSVGVNSQRATARWRGYFRPASANSQVVTAASSCLLGRRQHARLQGTGAADSTPPAPRGRHPHRQHVRSALAHLHDHPAGRSRARHDQAVQPQAGEGQGGNGGCLEAEDTSGADSHAEG